STSSGRWSGSSPPRAPAAGSPSWVSSPWAPSAASSSPPWPPPAMAPGGSWRPGRGDLAKPTEPRPADRQRPAHEGKKRTPPVVQVLLQVVLPLGVTATLARLSQLPAVVNWLLALGLLCYLAWWFRRYRKRRLDRLRIQNPDDLSITEEDIRGRDGDSR